MRQKMRRHSKLSIRLNPVVGPFFITFPIEKSPKIPRNEKDIAAFGFFVMDDSVMNTQW